MVIFHFNKPTTKHQTSGSQMTSADVWLPEYSPQKKSRHMNLMSCLNVFVRQTLTIELQRFWFIHSTHNIVLTSSILAHIHDVSALVTHLFSMLYVKAAMMMLFSIWRKHWRLKACHTSIVASHSPRQHNTPDIIKNSCQITTFIYYLLW